MPEVSHETLLAYLHQHGERYSLDALRRALLDQGFDAAAVEAACQSYLAETPDLHPKLSSGRAWVQACAGLFLAGMVLAILLVGTCVAGFFVMMSSENKSQSPIGLLILLLLVGLTLFLPVKVLRSARRRSMPGHGGRYNGPAPSLFPPTPEETAETIHETLLAYLRQHGPTTGVDDLRKDLLAQGHDPADVHRAFLDYWSRGDSR